MSRIDRKTARSVRHRRIRRRVIGTAEKPRMAVMISGQHMYVQFIDDIEGRTKASVSTLGEKAKVNKQEGTLLGQKAAEVAVKAGIKRVVVDRGGFKFHGKLKAIVDAAVAGGLVISDGEEK